MANPKRQRRAAGGKASKNLYNAKGSPEGGEAEKEKSEGFKRGGLAKGGDSKKRLDKRARGGGLRKGHYNSHGTKVHHGNGMKRYAAGGSPYSSGHNLSELEGGGSGHEGEKSGREP